jgi:hypothetical protein
MTVVSNKIMVSWNRTWSSLIESTSALEKSTDSILKTEVADFCKTLAPSTKLCIVTSLKPAVLSGGQGWASQPDHFSNKDETPAPTEDEAGQA